MAHPRKGSKAILDDQDETDGSGGSYKIPEIPLEESSLDGDLLLSRYIKNLPSGRLTRSRQAASRTTDHEARYPVKVLATSFDQLSTSDYSSNVSNALSSMALYSHLDTSIWDQTMPALATAFGFIVMSV